MASDLSLKIRLEMQTAQGETALQRFTAAYEAALKKLGRSDAEIGIIKALAAEVESGKKKLDELPSQYRRDVEEINRIGRGVRLLGELGIDRSHAQIRAEIERIKTAFGELKASGVLSRSELAQAADRARMKVRELAESMNGARTAVEKMAGALGLVRGAFAAIAAVAGGNAIVRMADEMQLLAARLKLTEGSSRAAKERLDELFAIANRAGADIGAVGGGYVKMADSIRKAGGSTKDAVAFTEALALALKVSGASAEQTGAVMLQLGQSLQKGKLQGDEFVSVAENGGKVLDYLAGALGISRGRLAEMSQAGELTTDRLLRLNDALGRIRQDAESMPRTVGEAVTNLGNAARRWVHDANEASGATRVLAAAIQFLADHFGKLADIVMLIGAGTVLANLGRLRAALVGIGAALGIVAGMHPVVRALMLAVSGLTLLSGPVQRMWDAIFGGAPDKAQRLAGTIGETQKTLENLSGAIANVAAEMDTRLSAAVQRATDAARSLGDGYKDAEGQIKAALAGQIAAIEAAAQRRLDAARQSARGETQEAVAATAIVLEAERNKLSAVDAAAARMLDVWRRTHGEAVNAARAAGLDVAAIERQAVDARIAIYSQLESAYRASIDRLIAEERRHLDAVRRIEEERAALKMGVEDRIRALMQRGMGELDAYADRWRQVDEKQAAAQTALAAGHFEQARKLAEQAMQLAESNARAVKDGQREIVSEQQAVARAVQEVAEAAKIADAALAGMSGARQQQAQHVGRELDAARRDLDEISAKLDALRAKQGAAISVKIDADAAALRQAVEEVAKLKAAAQDAKAAQEAIGALAVELDKLKNGGASITVEAKTDAAIDAIDRLRNAAGRVEIPFMANAEEARAQLASLKAEIAQPSTHTILPDASGAKAVIADLQRPTSSTHTVYVREVREHAAGGLIRRLAEGGRAFRRMMGRITGPGTETSDSIPAMLSHGEFVVRAASVRKFGAAFFEALNRGFLPPMPRYAMGGLVASATPNVASNAVTARDVVDLRFHIGGKAHTVQSSRATAMQLASALRELSRGA